MDVPRRVARCAAEHGLGSVVAVRKVSSPLTNLLMPWGVPLPPGTADGYLFAGGVVHRRRSRIIVVPWAELAEVGVTWRGDQLLGYDVVTTWGRRLPIEARPGGNMDAFCDQLTAAAAARGIPVVDRSWH